MTHHVAHVDTKSESLAVVETPAFPAALASSIPAHEHRGSICSVRGSDHAYCPPQPGDKRSPCPALNALANHGFIPRDGKDMGPVVLFRALTGVYRMSGFCAFFVVLFGFIILGQHRKVSLYDFSRHDCIEHDASLFHANTPDGDEYAPTELSDSLTKTTLQQCGQHIPGRMTLEDVAKIRANREKALSKPLKWWQGIIARGEIALFMGVFGGKDVAQNGLDLDLLHRFVTEERFPDGWKADHTQGLFKTVSMALVIRNHMNQ